MATTISEQVDTTSYVCRFTFGLFYMSFIDMFIWIDCAAQKCFIFRDLFHPLIYHQKWYQQGRDDGRRPDGVT